uniref:Uncharacterized protein LOC116938184 isoform X2 n=1 Tax=Petromyzon marinus TaxID=7757 RepID=A0AAJ7SMF6_PETMA|nr:uncharacterized protein LOC116938184 isoform X2 [Petromyzon marinus]
MTSSRGEPAQRVGRAMMMMRSSSMEEDEEERERLGEAIYSVVERSYPEMADRITGSLMELSVTELSSLLRCPETLRARVERAAAAIDEFWRERDRLGELLYPRVEKLCPDNCSRITGMLLELDMDTLKLLAGGDGGDGDHSHHVLKAMVSKAQEALKQHQQQLQQQQQDDGDGGDGGDGDGGDCGGGDGGDDDELGEQLYRYLVASGRAKTADVITGMLLEIPHDALRQLLRSPQQLDEKISLADEALRASQ